MSITEQAISFDCRGETLIGVVSAPGFVRDSTRIAVLVVVGGPQYRAGSHRQFVELTRAIARAGYWAMRFDYRGMGDSSGDRRDFEAVSADIGAAIDALMREEPRLKSVVLLGLCDGASATLLYLDETHDHRVGALCLLNPWVRSEASLAQVHVKHYYTQRLAQRDFWRKLVRGRVGLRALLALGRSVQSLLAARTAGRASPRSFREAMLEGWRQFNGPVLLALSGADLTAKEFIEHTAARAEWAPLLADPKVRHIDLPDADHTLSREEGRHVFEAAVADWLETVSPSIAAGRLG